MFTGIVETIGIVRSIKKDRSNVHFEIESPFSHELKIDQSVSHNGVCLTVVEVGERGTKDAGSGEDWARSEAPNPQSPVPGPPNAFHTVTAVEETLLRSNLGALAVGDFVNLERCLPMGGRLDGHIVQGHVDAVAQVLEALETGGSWRYTFRYQPSPEHLLVDKGSVCLNGVSLTVVAPKDDVFSVAIIPYTWEHTNFKRLRAGDSVNIEFDIIGKYIGRYLAAYLPK
jgi:riboflavin synthase